MELRHLRYFTALAEELHFGRAASRLNISQPPLSQQIKALEVELDVRLFERTKRQVQLTEAGRLFLDEARATLAQAERARSIAGRAQRGEIGELHLGLFASAPLSISVSAALTAFRRSHPEVSLNLRERTSPQQIEDLQSERLDLGFLRSHIRPTLPDRLTSLEVAREKLHVFLPKAHRLSTSDKPLSITALASEEFVFFDRQVRSTLHDQVYSLCAAAGYTPRVSQEANTNSMIMGLVAAGLGVSVLPAAQAQAGSPRIHTRPLKAPGAVTATWMAYRMERPDPMVDWFIDYFKTAGVRAEG